MSESRSADYVVWESVPLGSACMLEPLEGVERDWELRRGVSRAKGFPANAKMRMRAGDSRAKVLLDSVMNLAGLLVVSPKLRGFLEKEKVPGIEYLPITVLDMKGAVASKTYSIVNSIQLQDCLSAKSRPRLDSDGRVERVATLILDPKRIDPAAQLFGITNFPAPIVASRALSEKLLAGGFRGVLFLELDRYGK